MAAASPASHTDGVCSSGRHFFLNSSWKFNTSTGRFCMPSTEVQPLSLTGANTVWWSNILQ